MKEPAKARNVAVAEPPRRSERPIAAERPALTNGDTTQYPVPAVDKALDTRDVQDKLAAQGCEILKGTPVQFGNMVKDELPKWARIVKESGAKLD